MKLHQMVKTTSKSKKRVGRGIGSGRGKTSGRGMKGQKARGKVALGFVGSTMPLYKKLPLRRGWGNVKRSVKPVILPLSKLATVKSGSEVTLETLIKEGIISAKQVNRRGIKVTGEGEIKIALTFKVPTTAAARIKIEKAGGKVVNV